MKGFGAMVLFVLASTTVISNGVVVPPYPVERDLGGFVMNTHNVHIKVENGIATVVIEEEFENTSKRLLEAVYLFPIPSSAVISDFTMKIGDQVLKGEVLPADQAREIYQEIVAKMKDPALLEYVGTQLIRMSIYPFEPGEKRQFLIQYSQPLEISSNSYSMIYPLKIDSFLSAPIGTVSIRVSVPFQIAEVYSPTHPFKEMIGASGRDYIFSATDFMPGSDVALVLTSSEDEIPSSLATHWDDAMNEGYFLLTIIPRLKEETIIPKDVVFVLDISGSMYGEKIEQAKRALKQVLQMLRSGDRFAIVTFDGQVHNLTGGLLDASERAVWIENVRRIQADGMTNIYDALQTSIDMFSKDDQGRFKVLLFLTDGAPTEGITDTGKIINDATPEARARNIHLFSFGVGTGVVAELLDRLVQENAGRVSYIVEGENIEGKVTDLYRTIETPALENVTISIEGSEVAKVLPTGPHSLFSGQALRLSGIYFEEGDLKVIVEGTRGGERYRYEYLFRVSKKPDSPFIAKIWAQKRIAHLANFYRYDSSLSEAAKEEVKQEIIALSKKFNIINEFTSYLIAPERVQTSTMGDRGGFSGAPAVDAVMAAKSVAEMEQDQFVEGGASDYKFVDSVGFALEGEIWIQDDEKVKTLEPISLVAYSEAYFELADRSKWVEKVFALGEKVKFIFNGILFEISDEGIESVEELNEILK
ncbi:MULTISPECIES: VIT domain-containing protein [unclassified Mesotoga]|uniref:VIT domain-containing protein n=1 Tax=unclassified Mesotoga TaxID=1184398 RepID=UPI000DA65009|nr:MULTISPECIES: VIT domain-containing protein [unclassified Mesotoga]PZC51931.1 von Willebrand factor type A [Mesotoga sp. TolDC]